MKTKEFWKVVCEELEFRFFTGVPFDDFKRLFNTMDTKFLHFVPAISKSIAIGLASGTYISGIKSVVLIDNTSLKKLKNEIFNFNVKYRIPVLFVTEKSNKDLGLKEFTFDEISELNDYMYKDEHLPCVLVLNAEELE